MATVDVDAFANFLKRRYTDKKIIDMMVKRSKLWGLLDKDTGFGGDGKTDVPVITDNGQGVGGTFYAAKQNKSAGTDAKFSVPRRKLYGLFSVGGEVMRASAKKDLAFLGAKAKNLDGIYKTYGREQGIHLFRDGTGRRARLSATCVLDNTADLTLENATDIRYLSRDMAISLTAAGVTYRNPGTDAKGNIRGAVVYIVSINENTGGFRVSNVRGGASVAITSVITLAAVSDYIVRDGDLNTVPHGVAAYVPDADPDNTLFMNVDRSVDVRKLAGYRMGTTAVPVSFTGSNVTKMISTMNDFEADTDILVCGKDSFTSLEIELGAKKVYETETGSKRRMNARGYRGADGESEVFAEIGFNALVIKGSNGDVAVIQDTFCPSNRAYALDSSTWEFSSDGKMPDILAEDNGDILLRDQDADEYEGRIGGFGNLVCHAPGLNGVMILG